MNIISLSPQEVANLAEDLTNAATTGSSVLVAIDGPPQERDRTFKIKINGGVWSPPMGEAYR